MNVMLIGHACGPGLGSEPGFTWNWAQFLSLKHQVWVVAYPEHRAAVEAHLAHNPNPNLRFVWVTSNHPLDPWRPEKGDRGVQIHYLLWLKEAYKRAAELCAHESIDLAHHVSLGTVGAPPPFERLPVPAIWGPIGGGQTTPAPFLPLFGHRRWVERIRSARVRSLGFSRRLRLTVSHSKMIFATNRDTLHLLEQAGGAGRVRLLLDCGLPPGYGPARPKSPQDTAGYTLLWAGRLENRKGPQLALRALAQVKNAGVKLLVAGQGPLEGELRRLAGTLNLAGRVEFLGSVPYEEMPRLFQSSSAFLFTSLRDSFGSVVLEALAYGLPVITLDHQGVGTFVPAAAALKVPVSDPDQTTAALARGIDELADSPAKAEAMRSAACSFAREQSWDCRAARMSELYEELVHQTKLG